MPAWAWVSMTLALSFVAWAVPHRIRMSRMNNWPPAAVMTLMRVMFVLSMPGIITLSVVAILINGVIGFIVSIVEETRDVAVWIGSHWRIYNLEVVAEVMRNSRAKWNTDGTRKRAADGSDVDSDDEYPTNPEDDAERHGLK